MKLKHVKTIRRIFIFVALLLIIAGVLNDSIKIVYPLKYSEYVYKYAKLNDLDPLLVFSIIKAESRFDKNATSQKNAKGLMQITDNTGKWAAQKLGMKNFTVQKLYEPETNIMIGCWYFGKLIKDFDNDIELAILAYNGGSGNVNRWIKDGKIKKTDSGVDTVPFKETENYVKSVKKYYYVYKMLYDNK